MRAEGEQMIYDGIGEGGGAATVHGPSHDVIGQVRTTLPDALQGLLKELEAKDRPTYERSLRAAELARRVGLDAGITGRRLGALATAALLHDLGKLATPDNILKSTGALTEKEMTIVREHPGIGEAFLLHHAPELDLAAHFVRWHHERPDGHGYPDGLPGEAIPLEARILAVIDAFAAMTSNCYHRTAFSTEQAIAVLHAHAGTQWEARSVALLVREVTTAV
jgi:HD-GYP domain-containing protein (c-di-GMP phosphodiesterase class II)